MKVDVHALFIEMLVAVGHESKK